MLFRKMESLTSKLTDKRAELSYPFLIKKEVLLGVSHVTLICLSADEVSFLLVSAQVTWHLLLDWEGSGLCL